MSEISKAESDRMVLQMNNALAAQDCVPLFMVGGKEIGGGYRNYAIAGDIDRDHILYVLKRLIKLIDGTVSREVEGN